eukprot:3597596-Rhodomonas_salina.3
MRCVEHFLPAGMHRSTRVPQYVACRSGLFPGYPGCRDPGYPGHYTRGSTWGKEFSLGSPLHIRVA